MSLDITKLVSAECREVRVNGVVTMHIWHGRAYGEYVRFQTPDLEARYWVSTILTMREQGVALVDATGQMVAHSRRDR